MPFGINHYICGVNQSNISDMNNLENRVKELESKVEDLLLQTSLLTAKHISMFEMVFGVYKETLPNEHFKLIAKKYLEVYENTIKSSFEELKDMIDHNKDSSFFLRQKMELTIELEALRNYLCLTD